MAYKVEVDREKCVGCGACASLCDNFELSEGKARPVESHIDEPGCSKDAADSCPVQAITVEEIKEED